MGVIQRVSHKACGIFNFSLPRRKKHILLTNTHRTEKKIRTIFLWKSLNLPPFPYCLITTLLQHVNLYSQHVDLAEDEPSTTKTYC